MWQPDNWVGNASFWRILDSFPNIDVYLNTAVVLEPGSVVVVNSTIVSMTTESTDGSATQVWQGDVFIDASYDGDLLVMAGCDWTYGVSPFEDVFYHY